MINHLKQIFLSQDSWSTIGYKSRIRFIRHGSNLFGERICDHDTIGIHVFTNLLYNSRNLTKNFSKKNRFFTFTNKLYLHFSQEGREPRGWGRGVTLFFFLENSFQTIIIYKHFRVSLLSMASLQERGGGCPNIFFLETIHFGVSMWKKVWKWIFFIFFILQINSFVEKHLFNFLIYYRVLLWRHYFFKRKNCSI